MKTTILQNTEIQGHLIVRGGSGAFIELPTLTTAPQPDATVHVLGIRVT